MSDKNEKRPIQTPIEKKGLNVSGAIGMPKPQAPAKQPASPVTAPKTDNKK